MTASIFLMAISAFASGKSSQAITSRTWTVDGQFTTIVAKGNIEVILVPDVSQTIRIEGNEKFVNALYLQVENNVLTLSGLKGSSKNRTIVYVPVRKLKKVTLKGGSNLSSKGRLESKRLYIRIEGMSFVNVKNLGDIIIDSDDHYQFNYEKEERSIVRIEKA
jgi:hypothetical protein